MHGIIAGNSYPRREKGGNMQKKADSIADSKFYIVPERFREQKKKIGCNYDAIAEYLNVSRRTLEYWTGKKDPRPIPEDSLQKLCEYMDVSPDWLTGKTDRFTALNGSGSKEWINAQQSFRNRRLLIEYMKQAGITDGRSKTVHGVSLTNAEYWSMIYGLERIIAVTCENFARTASLYRDPE